MSNVGATVQRKLATVAREVGKADRAALNTGALAAKREIEGQRDRDGVKRLRNVGRGANLGVSYTVAGESATVRATGPWQIIERDTKAHTIGPRRRRRGGKAVRLSDGNVRGSVPHPGTKGKHTFEKGAARGAAKAAEKMRDPIIDAARRGFKS